MLKLVDHGPVSKVTMGYMTGPFTESSLPPYNKYNCLVNDPNHTNPPWCPHNTDDIPPQEPDELYGEEIRG